jgi:bifunctional DNA-binding transcriptional regulator/antitoxin component of YhaV-PrlF toxin-antitoxin module
VVTLPKEWINANSLKPGDKVYVVEEEARIIIMPYAKQGPGKAEMVVDLDRLGLIDEDPVSTAKRVLGCAYIMGVDSLLIKAEKRLLRTIADEAPRLGYPIIAVSVDEEAGLLKISNIIDFSKLEPRHSIKSFARMVESVVEILDSFSRGETSRTEALEALSRIKLETMGLERMLIRALLEPRLAGEEKHMYSMLLSASLLTLMVDALVSDVRFVIERSLKVSETARSKAKTLSKLAQEAVLLLANPSITRIREANTKVVNGMREVQELRVSSTARGDSLILASIANSYRILVILLHTSFCLALSLRASRQGQGDS